MSTQIQVPDQLQSDSIEARIIKQKIWDRIHNRNQHFMAAVVGREGMGKSMTGLKLCETCDPTFHAGRVMFEPKSFLERLQEWKAAGETKGKMVVADEAGVGLGTRTWYEKDQIIFNQVLQVIRDENMGMIFTLPRLTELDSQTRGRLHALLEMTKVHPGDYAELKWFDWSPSRDERDRIYRNYPRLDVGNVTRQIRRLQIGPPSDELVASYEARKNEFQDELYQDAIDEMGDDPDDEKSVKEVAMEIANGEIADYVDRHNQNNTPYINDRLIRADYELSQNDAKAVKDLLNRQFSKEELENHV